MNAEQILKYHRLKNTGCRKFIITELLQNDSALSENEIKQALPDLFDRVTFYRSLKTLEEYKIIHRIVLHDQILCALAFKIKGTGRVSICLWRIRAVGNTRVLKIN